MDEEKTGNPEDLGQRPRAGEASGKPDALPGHEGDGNPGIDKVRANGRSPLHVKLAVYDGPLDLLLELIKKNEMDIYDIQIAEITRQYLETLAHMKQLDLEVAGEFIVMAATLIYIKSKMLLPVEKDNLEDEDGQDPRAELVRKLLEYQAFKEAAKELGLLENERGKVFTRQIADYYLSDLDAADVGIDEFSADLYDLLSAFQAVVTRTGHESVHEVYEEVVSIEEKMSEIKGMLIGNKRLVFSRLFKPNSSRHLLIVTFLALLEIVRTRFARVQQEKQFGEIVIERTED